MSLETHISRTPEATYTLVPVTATAPAFGPFATSECSRRFQHVFALTMLEKAPVSPLSAAGETILPVTATAPTSEPLPMSKYCG